MKEQNELADPSLADRLKASLREGLQYARGETDLVQTIVPVGRVYTGEDVVAIRQRRGLSQAQFARLLAVSVKTLQSWEQNHRRPSKPTMRLLQIFDTPEDFREVLRVSEGGAPPYAVRSEAGTDGTD